MPNCDLFLIVRRMTVIDGSPQARLGDGVIGVRGRGTRPWEGHA